MKTQTTANTATPVVDLEHVVSNRERADDDSWVASFDSEVQAVAQAYDGLVPLAEPVAPAPPKRSRLRIPLVVAGVCGSVIVAGWFVWQTWTATPAASAAPPGDCRPFRDRGLQVASRRRRPSRLTAPCEG